MLLLALLTTVAVAGDEDGMGAPEKSTANCKRGSSTGSNASSRSSSDHFLDGTVSGLGLMHEGGASSGKVPVLVLAKLTEEAVRERMVKMRLTIGEALKQPELSADKRAGFQAIAEKLSGLQSSTDWEGSAESIQSAYEQVMAWQLELKALSPVADEEEGTRGHNSLPAARPTTAAAASHGFGQALSPGGNRGDEQEGDGDPFAHANAKDSIPDEMRRRGVFPETKGDGEKKDPLVVG